jgi:sugar phosphate isomerase/epimerase
MRFGCCIWLGGYIPPEAKSQGKTSADSFEESVNWLVKNIAFLKSVGYDYVELPVVGIANLNDEEFNYFANRVRAAELRAEVFNCFIPGSLKIVGKDIDVNAINSYLQMAVARTFQCGAELIVFGGGEARNVPDGYPIYMAESQISDFLNTAAELALARDMVIAIEPLNRNECNVINLVGDAVELATDLGKPQIKVIADFFHMNEENESVDSIIDAGPLLSHMHLADSGRLNPGTGSYNYPELFSTLKEINYKGRASLECSYKDYEKDVQFSLQFLKNEWAKA